ncbi:anti-sigma factor family protein [Corynebacterium caspium]|uniref:anti-sigma factor family protein n=1 Tax=Corynebacterium caspium TaxID=234828 RepID=UPI00036260F0|nr:zf-HC2 domain-containing protein [Corynebacterium caspium]WKD59503.1 Anti-sigma-E factor RseA [Corynebacterium caspium DSM 44850]
MSGVKHTGAYARKLFAHTDHLNPEAIAAYVDDELIPAARRRARHHLRECPACQTEVQKQRAAAEALHYNNFSADVRAPQALVAKLTEIAEASCPGPDAFHIPCPEPETLLDKVETLFRILKRGGCSAPADMGEPSGKPGNLDSHS